MSKIKSPKEYLQGKYNWHKKHWNEHEVVDDEFTASEMQAYHEYASKLEMEQKIEEIENLVDTDNSFSWSTEVEKIIKILKK